MEAIQHCASVAAATSTVTPKRRTRGCRGGRKQKTYTISEGYDKSYYTLHKQFAPGGFMHVKGVFGEENIVLLSSLLRKIGMDVGIKKQHNYKTMDMKTSSGS